MPSTKAITRTKYVLKKKMKVKKISITLSKKNFSIILDKGVFLPNFTTKLLLSEIKNYSLKKKSILNVLLI